MNLTSKGLDMKWVVKELVRNKLISTFLPKDEARILFAKLAHKGVECILYSIRDDKLWLEDSYQQKFDALTINTSVTSDSFNDHSGLSEHSTMQDRYNKTGRL